MNYYYIIESKNHATCVCVYMCKDWVWIPDPKDEQARVQKAQNNKFVKSGLENWAKMSWIANKVDSSDKNKKINGFQLKKVVHGEIRGDQFLYLYLKYDYKFISWLLQCFSFDFSSSFPWRVSYII